MIGKYRVAKHEFLKGELTRNVSVRSIGGPSATLNSTADIAGATAIATGVGMTPGSGILGQAEIYKSSVYTKGNIIYTDILIDLTGLSSGDEANDIIGKADGKANCHIGQITAAVNGTIFGGWVRCLEVPTGGDPDVDLWYADEATGVEDTDVTDLTNQVQVTNNGDHTIGRVTPFLDTVFPAADKYLYLACGDATDDVYTAGRLWIHMWGYAA